jgi:hypothetical protein
MNRILLPILVGTLALSAAACGGRQNTDSTSTSTAPAAAEVTATATVRLIHASEAPTALAFLNSDQVGSLDPGQISGALEVPVGSHTLSIRATDGTTTLGSARLTFAEGESYIGLAAGTASDFSLIWLEDGIPTPPAGQAFVRFVNSGLSAISLHAGEQTLTSSLNPGASTNFMQMAPESYRIEGTAGNRSGGVSVALQAGRTYLIATSVAGDELNYHVITLQ